MKQALQIIMLAFLAGALILILGHFAKVVDARGDEIDVVQLCRSTEWTDIEYSTPANNVCHERYLKGTADRSLKADYEHDAPLSGWTMADADDQARQLSATFSCRWYRRVLQRVVRPKRIVR